MDTDTGDCKISDGWISVVIPATVIFFYFSSESSGESLKILFSDVWSDTGTDADMG